MAHEAAMHFDARISVVPGRVYHLWHGDTATRHYHRRAVQLQELMFNPETDVRVGDGGALEWTNANSKLRIWARNYFEWRKEDG